MIGVFRTGLTDVHVCARIVMSRHCRVLQFTGSGRVAERLSEITRGKVKIEDAGFDWKILGPDVQVFIAKDEQTGHSSAKLSFPLFSPG